MSKIVIVDKDDHIIILQHGTQTAEFSQLGNTFFAMLEQAHKWGKNEGSFAHPKLTPYLINLYRTTTEE